MNSASIRIVDVPDLADAMPLSSACKGHTSDSTRTLIGRILDFMSAASHRVAGSIKTQRKSKALKLCESISLGEKRFLAIVQIDEERILIGGSASSVALLTRLAEKEQFSSVLLERSQAMDSA